MFWVYSLFSLGRQEIENLYFYPKIEILQSLGKKYNRLNAYQDIKLKGLHPTLKLIDVKRIIVLNILRSKIEHWKQNFNGHITQSWYCNGEQNLNAFQLLVKHGLIPTKNWKIEKYVSCMRSYDWFFKKVEDIIIAFLDKNYA